MITRGGGRGCQEVEFAGAAGGVGAGPAVELEQDAADVHLHGARAEEELARDLPVGAAGGDEPDDVDLAAGEPRARRPGPGLLAQPPLPALAPGTPGARRPGRGLLPPPATPGSRRGHAGRRPGARRAGWRRGAAPSGAPRS